MPISKPLVSIIIPTFNRASYISDAISSCASRSSDGHEVEIIVVDDGSTDNTLDVLQGFEGKIRYLPLHQNQGRNRARNIGLANANGTYVKFLDSDDILEKGSLETEVATADETGADIVASGWQSFEQDPDGTPQFFSRYDPPGFEEPYIDRLLAGAAVPTGAALYRKSLIADLTWDESLRKLDDWDWFVRAALRAGKIVTANVVAYSWRHHAGQGIQSESMLKNATEHYVILRKLEHAIAEKGELDSRRKRRLAQYFYKELRVFCLHDKDTFDKVVDHIYELDPHFVPFDEERQPWMRWLCRMVGVGRAVSFHSSIKRLVQRTRNQNGVNQPRQPMP